MSGKVLELKNIINRDGLAKDIANKWDTWNQQRAKWRDEKLEIRNYVFATDTTTTTNSTNPWKNKTTIPKLAQIRDNLHANYMAALFPNDDWLRWEGYDKGSETKAKKNVVQAYMQNKLRESNFRGVVSNLIYDYIDFGNAFADVEYIEDTTVDPDTGEIIHGYVGPRAIRVNPFDHVFDPTAVNYVDAPKISRYVKTIGELEDEVITHPELGYNEEIVKYLREVRSSFSGQYTVDDFEKAVGFSVDGFGSLEEYYGSHFIELLEFEGSIYDPNTGEFLRNQLITIVDRSKVIRSVPQPSWLGKGTKRHCGWRLRQDNLYAMGPLDNLVGMQYRMDHLENLKADAMDLAVHPPLAVRGNIEEFVWQPGEVIDLGDDGNVDELGKNLNGVIAANNEIFQLEQRMEEMAGAPKQAMGIRTPGEKTAYEVQSLENAAGRIFQDKVTDFEINLLEPLLNLMLEISRRNLDTADLVRVMDDDLGVVDFISITKEDITARGKIRPIGARHFAARATLIQNLTGMMNSSLGQMVVPHIKSFSAAGLIEETMGLSRFDLFEEDAQIFEQARRQKLSISAQEDVDNFQAVDTSVDIPEGF